MIEIGADDTTHKTRFYVNLIHLTVFSSAPCSPSGIRHNSMQHGSSVHSRPRRRIARWQGTRRTDLFCVSMGIIHDGSHSPS